MLSLITPPTYLPAASPIWIFNNHQWLYSETVEENIKFTLMLNLFHKFNFRQRDLHPTPVVLLFLYWTFDAVM